VKANDDNVAASVPVRYQESRTYLVCGHHPGTAIKVVEFDADLKVVARRLVHVETDVTGDRIAAVLCSCLR